MFTHVGKYQARIASMDILGMPARADYRAVPRVVFTDPELAAVGMSEEDARAAGIDAVSATVDLPASVARAYTYERDPRGIFKLTVDRERQVVVGASPLAGEWIHTVVLAIRAEIPLAVLNDTIAQFPTFSEAWGYALRALPDQHVLLAADFAAHASMAES
jgi:dihydrolipoamide dehydrogenase